MSALIGFYPGEEKITGNENGSTRDVAYLNRVFRVDFTETMTLE